MGRQNPTSATDVQDDNESTYELLGQEIPKAQKVIVRGALMDGSAMEIGLASTILMLPMLVLTAVLIALVFTHEMPNHSSTFLDESGTELALGSAYYVNYSMILFSYPLAREIVKNPTKVIHCTCRLHFSSNL